MTDARRNASGSERIATIGMVERPSGLLVTADIDAAVPTNGNGHHGPDFSFDPDGRRRIVLTKADQRKIDQAIRLLTAAGLGIVVACRAGQPLKPGVETCGEALLNEGKGTPDAGYGCRCSRLHFI